MLSPEMTLDPEKIKKYLRHGKSSFKTFSMGYTNPQKEMIERFDLKVQKDFDHFGSITDMEGLNAFLSTLGTNTPDDIKKMEKLVMSITRKVLKGYKKKHFWMDIRVRQPNHDFDIPRWHKDGPFFSSTDPNELNTSKFVTVLKGPGTLLIKGTKHVNQILEEYWQERRKEARPTKTKKEMIEQSVRLENKFRPILAEKLADEQVVQVKNSQGLVFFTGVPFEKGALHSEPPIDVPRMFISILPSSEVNIMGLQERWSK